MAEWCHKLGVEIWAYCLMPNYVHLIAVPESEDGLRRAIGEAHRRYTRYVNFRQKWTGHLWQGRFASFLMDEGYLLAAARYIELNTVKAGLVKHPEEYVWSSAQAHAARQDYDPVAVKPLLRMIDDWSKFLSNSTMGEEIAFFRRHEQTGRPLRSAEFINHLENKLSRTLTPQKGGRARKTL